MHQTLDRLAAPPITHCNPQIDLFAAHPAAGVVGGGSLWQEQWRLQSMRLSRFDACPQARRFAAEVERQRPGPEVAPLTQSYAWSWPSYPSLVANAEFAYERLPNFRLGGLRSAERRDALVELLQDIARPIAHALNRPCPVYETGQQRRVEFLGCIAWVADRGQRRLRMELRDADGRWQASNRAFDPREALRDPAWITQALLRWLPRIEQRFGADAETAHEWLRGKLAQRYANPESVRASSRQIEKELLTQPALADLLARAWRFRPWGEQLSETYSGWWRHEENWTALRQRSRSLMLLHYLFQQHDKLPPDADVGRLRARCRELGLGTAGWRFLCRHGDEAFDALADAHPAPRRFLIPQFLLSYAQWQAAGGLRRPLPACFAPGIMGNGGNWYDEEEDRAEVGLDPRFARLTEAHLPPPFGDGGPPIDLEDWRAVLDWLASAKPRLDRNQWRSGWPALQRAAARWQRRHENCTWESPLQEFRQGDWRVRPLTRGHELLDEGERMQHCVGDYITRCLHGDYRVFTVEHAVSGKPEVTVGLRRGGQDWHLDQVRALRNGAPSEEMEELARVTRECYLKAIGQAPPPGGEA